MGQGMSQICEMMANKQGLACRSPIVLDRGGEFLLTMANFISPDVITQRRKTRPSPVAWIFRPADRASHRFHRGLNPRLTEKQKQIPVSTPGDRKADQIIFAPV